MEIEQTKSLEQRLCSDFHSRSTDEMPVNSFAADFLSQHSVFVVEGFEERSVGILEMLAARKITIPELIIARYDEETGPNTRYRDRFQFAAEKVCPGRWRTIHNSDDGQWINEALSLMRGDKVFLDITGASNRALFGVLDAALAGRSDILIGYSEAREYWPRRSEWETLQKELSTPGDLSRVIDEKPWLFGFQHKYELVLGHEGYDSAGTARALIAFLPFKPARLASVIGEEEYSEFLFIVGRPRLPENEWRRQALIEINTDIIRQSAIREISTFEYRKAFQELVSIAFENPGLLQTHDVHLALMGSKLQVVASWALSSIVRSITVVTSVPLKYFPEAFSEGIGAQWAFPLIAPRFK